MKKVYRLKRSWCFVLGIITCIALALVVRLAVETIKEDVKICDQQKGYACSIWEIKDIRK